MKRVLALALFATGVARAATYARLAEHHDLRGSRNAPSCINGKTVEITGTVVVGVRSVHRERSRGLRVPGGGIPD